MNVTRGILLLEPGASRPAGLEGDEVLAECHDPYRALADLVILGHAEQRRAAWGLDGVHRLRLVIAPVRGADFDALATRLVDAVRRAVPSVSIEDLRGAHRPTPAPAVPLPAPRSAPVSESKPAPSPPPASPRAPAPAPAPLDELDDPERLSADEIAMLLDDEENAR